MEHIFLLEDDDALGRGIAMALESAERPVVRTTSIAQAKESLAAQRFDLLILDINLPGWICCVSFEQAATIHRSFCSLPMIWNWMK